MKTLLFDPTPGASGDMLLASLVDLGVSPTLLRRQLRFMPAFTLRVREVVKHGVAAKQVSFRTNARIDEHAFIPLVRKSALSPMVKEQAIAVFERIFSVERRVHRARHLHLHELADADTLFDVVGTLSAIEDLGVERVICRPLKAGTGFITTHEGSMPAFNFATALLLRGCPVDFLPVAAELTTPTAAAILGVVAEFADRFSLSRIQRVGIGAGTMELTDQPNVLRAFLGEIAAFDHDRCIVIESNIDDANPQDYELLFERLYDAGAREVYLTPVIMKHTRPGILLTVLADPGNERIGELILKETTSIGIRMSNVVRTLLPRHVVTVKTPLGTVRVKRLGAQAGGRFSLEYRDIKRIAQQQRKPIGVVRARVEQYVLRHL